MPSLIISDLHLTDSPLEDYRWGVFDWINDVLFEEYNFDQLFILGDLTEKKDNHSAKLVNRLSSELTFLANKLPVTILRGNHDGIDPEWPFFLFLQSNPYLDYYYKPTKASGAVFLPHSRQPETDWHDILNKKDLNFTDYIFMHQTVRGAVASNGFTMEGIDPDMFRDFTGVVFSGDIHKPQKIGNVVYVGSPYPVYFGDDFVGGAIILHDDKEDLLWERIVYKTIRRINLELDFSVPLPNGHFTVHKGDQFKVKLLVNRSDSDKFDEYRKLVSGMIKKKGGVLVSLELKLNEEKGNAIVKKRKFINTDPETVLKRYVKAEGLDEYYLEKGREFL